MSWKKIISGIATGLIVFFILAFIFENYVSMDQMTIFGDIYDYANESSKEMITAGFVENCETIKKLPSDRIEMINISNPQAIINLCQKFNDHQIDRRGLYFGVIDISIAENGINDPIAQLGETIPVLNWLIQLLAFFGRYALLFTILLFISIITINIREPILIGIITSKILIKVTYIFVLPFIVIYLYIWIFPIDTSAMIYAMANGKIPFSSWVQIVDLLVLSLVKIYTFAAFILGVAGMAIGFTAKYLLNKQQEKLYK